MSDPSFRLPDIPVPVHECIERPILPCPACWKWSGDAFATVRNNPKSFPGIIDLPTESAPLGIPEISIREVAPST
jgi:hypothetical protein